MQITGAMITQKPISLKIDTNILEDLDKEVALGWRKRNALINEAIRVYLVLADSRRRIKSYGRIEDQARELEQLIKKLLPGLIYSDASEKYILSVRAQESRYDVATSEACTTDCPCYVQGTCPYPYKDKLECHRFRAFYNEEEDI